MNRLESSNIIRAIAGSLSMALQRIPTTPNDIETDEQGVCEIQNFSTI